MRQLQFSLTPVKLMHFLLQLIKFRIHAIKTGVHTIETAIYLFFKPEKAELDCLCKIPHECFMGIQPVVNACEPLLQLHTVRIPLIA